MIRAFYDHVAGFHRAICRCAQGSVALIGALSIIVLVGMGAFAVEASAGYSTKVSNQRIADMAALAGALAYNVASDQTAMTATAKAVVTAQGLAASTAAVALVTDAATSKQLVQVTITTTVPLSLGRVLTTDTGFDVISVGMASTSSPSPAPPCIAALSSTVTNGVDLTGGTTLSAAGCAINTNAGVSVPYGTYITAKQVNAGKTVSNPGGGLTTAPTANQINQNKANAASDWASGLTALKAVLCQVNQLAGTSDPDYPDGNTVCTNPVVSPNSVGATDLNLNYSPSASLAVYFNSSNNTYTIPYSWISANYPGGKIKSLNISGGITVYLQGPLTLDMSAVSMGGTALHFGSGNVSIAGSIVLNGGALVDFDVGSGNTITIGNASGTSINVGGGSKLCFTLNCVAPTVLAGTFSVGGSTGGNITTSGGSTIVFPKAMTHVINGNLSLNGSSTFGSGSYIIKGNFTNNTGGAMTGVDVTFALGGTFTLSGGTSLDLAAPASSSTYGVPDVLIATKSSAATTIGGGSADKYAGLIYAPKSALNLSGGAAVSANSAACLMLIVNNIAISGGGTFSTGTCTGVTGSSGTTPSVALFK
jgi:hypothetical protein